MKHIILLAFSTFLLTLTSCKKPNIDFDEDPIERKNCLITESSFSNNGNTGKILYTYDDTKRVINVRYEDGSLTSNYVYKTNQIEEIIVEGQGTTEIIYTLDANNRVISTKQESSNPNRPNTEATFSYDGQGYLMEVVTKDLSTNTTSIEKYAYSNGNLIEFDNGTFRFGILYDTNIPYQESYYMPVRNSGYPKYYFHVLKKYMGKPSTLFTTGIVQGNIMNNFYFQIDENLNVVGLNLGNAINYTITHKYNCPEN